VRDSRQVLGDYETEVGAAGQAQAAMQSACIMEFKLQLASRTLKRELLKSTQLLAHLVFKRAAVASWQRRV
jgi:hypothetical protein